MISEQLTLESLEADMKLKSSAFKRYQQLFSKSLPTGQLIAEMKKEEQKVRSNLVFSTQQARELIPALRARIKGATSLNSKAAENKQELLSRLDSVEDFFKARFGK